MQLCTLFLSSDNLHKINNLHTFVDIQCDNLLMPPNGEIISCSSGRVGVEVGVKAIQYV